MSKTTKNHLETEEGPDSQIDLQSTTGVLQIESIIERPTELGLLEGDDGEPAQVPDDPTKGDLICDALKNDASPDSLYDTMLQEVAEELSFLKASRRAQYFGGGNFSSISEKRLKGLKTLADLVSLKNKEFAQLLGAEVDFKGEGFKNIMTLFLKLVKKSMEDSNIQPQMIQTVFARLQKELIGYEDKAKRVYKGEKVDNVLAGGDR